MVFDISLYLSLAIFTAGLTWRVYRWLRLKVGDRAQAPGPASRTLAAPAALLGSLRGLGALRLIRALVLDVLLLRRSLRQGFWRWLMHICLFYGFMGLLLMHALEGYVSQNLFPGYYSTLGPYLWLRDLFGAMVLLGVGLAIVRRLSNPLGRSLSGGRDLAAIVILAVIMASGFLLEGSKIISASRYQQMVNDYADLDGKEEQNALKAYWAKEFGVAFPGQKLSFSEDALEMGAELSEDSCAECHSSPQGAFVSWPVSRLLTPAASWLDRVDMPGILLAIHFLACFAGLAYLTFGKFWHILATPLALTVNGLDPGAAASAAAGANRRALDLDACTHCLACSEHCSVAPIFKQLPNLAILPSEKLCISKVMLQKDRLSKTELMALQEGSHICTSCNRCTQICPSGLNLQELWDDLKQELARRGYQGTYTMGRGLAACCMEPAKYPWPVRPDEELSFPLAAQGYRCCFQCQTCSNVCPVVAAVDDPHGTLDLLPHQIMHSLGLGMISQAQGARMTWDCLTCYLCQEHCPQRVPVADLLFELRALSLRGLRRAGGLGENRHG